MSSVPAAFTNNITAFDIGADNYYSGASELHWRHSSPMAVTLQATDVVEVPERTDWLKGAFQRLRQLSTLAANWDTYRAEPPNPQTLSQASRLFEILTHERMQPTTINPSVEGGVCVSFEHGDRYADIEYLNCGETLAVVSTGGKDTSVWEIGSNPIDLRQAIDRIQQFLAH